MMKAAPALLGAFDQVNEHFKALFTTLFRGGEAELRLVDADDPLMPRAWKSSLSRPENALARCL